MQNNTSSKSVNMLLSPLRWLNWRGRRAARNRAKDILPILESLNKYRTGIWEDEDLAREEFRGAVQRYLLGYYEDSIYHSCFSVETALLICLNKKMNNKEKMEEHNLINRKKRPKYLTFGRIKYKCESSKYNIINPSISNMIEEIIDIRNSHIHAYNFISAIIIQRVKHLNNQYFYLQDIENLNFLQKLFFMLLSRNMSIEILEEKLKAYMSLSNFTWCSKNNLREQVENSVEEYMKNVKKLVKNFLLARNNLKIKEMWDNLRNLYNELQIDAYFKKRSLKTLKLTYQILKQLNLL